jgi:serine/threonine protein kinase
MSQQQLSLIGLKVDDMIVDALLAEGMFSRVYHGTSLSTAAERLIKVAKKMDEPRLAPFAGATTARALLTGVKLDITPDCSELLKIQFEQLQQFTDGALLRPLNLVAEEGFALYQMESIKGITLRNAMQQNAQFSRLEFLLKLCDTVQRLSFLGFIHGDLKPDNVFVLNDGSAKLIDPGYSGPLNTDNGRYERVVVTTAAYYPSFQQDDLFALGVILFELACGFNPFLLDPDDAAITGQAGPQLSALVKRYSMTGNYNYKPLLKLKRPRDYQPALKPELEIVLLKSLRLRLESEHVLETDPGYPSIAELAAALKKLVNLGIKLQ